MSAISGFMHMNCSTAGTKNPCVTLFSSMTFAIATGSTSRTMTSSHPAVRPTHAHPPPPMWNSGIATRLTESGRKPSRLLNPSIAVKRFLFVSITPLGRPVVPDE